MEPGVSSPLLAQKRPDRCTALSDAKGQLRTSRSTQEVCGSRLFFFNNSVRCYVRTAVIGRALAEPEKALMVEPQIRYDDGAGYERYMGYWSRLAGETFLDWLAPPPGNHLAR
jgi:hypothetical protein